MPTFKSHLVRRRVYTRKVPPSSIGDNHRLFFFGLLLVLNETRATLGFARWFDSLRTHTLTYAHDEKLHVYRICIDDRVRWTSMREQHHTSYRSQYQMQTHSHGNTIVHLMQSSPRSAPSNLHDGASASAYIFLSIEQLLAGAPSCW